MKIGRNDPCPCGAGEKYKKCHGPADAERAVSRVYATPERIRADHKAHRYYCKVYKRRFNMEAPDVQPETHT